MGTFLTDAVSTSVPDLTPLTTALTSAITATQLLAILAQLVGIGMSFVLMWFGVRKAIGAFTAAVFGGRIRV